MRRVLVLSLLLAQACTIQVDAADYVGICQAGYRRCKGPTVEVCASDEESWVTEQVCGHTEVCRDAACVPANAPLPAPDAGVGAPDAGGEAPGRVVVVIPPLPDAGASAQGRVVSATVRMWLAQALPGSYVDVGFCPGVQAAEVLTGPPACDGSFFLRLEHTGGALRGQLYVHRPADGTIEPQLWSVDASELEPVQLETGELYELRFVDTGTPVDDAGDRQVAFELRGLARGAFASRVVSVPDEALAAFGLWNLDTGGTDEQALSGTASSLAVTVDDSQTWDARAFAAQAAAQGEILQSAPGSASLDFYVTRAVPAAALLPIR